MFVKPVRVFAVPPIRWSPRGLYISDLIWLRPEHTQKCLRSHRARPHFQIVRLLQYTAALRPECLEAQDQLLKGRRVWLGRSQSESPAEVMSDCNGTGQGQSARLRTSFLQHTPCDELFLNMPLERLQQKFP